ncbi:MAG TPA: RsmB/NOP family class I SAM-dependent RNA methyltransferase [Marmoricola sp.]|nr:RsmB/NOP family class I SAM-dependent RNA methyltransferase [Marmoricola sp.]
MDPARVLAFRVLREVELHDRYANLELSRQLRQARLPARDAAFATELVSGTLRMRAAYDAVLAQLVDRALDADVRDALRLGTHQLLGMRVSNHAAVGTTVELVKREIGFRPSGLVNAVLRKVAGRPLDEWLADQPLDVVTSHPRWVVDELARALDRPGELAPLLHADNARPTVTLVARPGLATRTELPGRPLDSSPYAVALDGGDPGAIAAVREGRAGVQDAGSQLVALALARADVVGADARWLDLCAGPGGKAALLAAVAATRGARVLANDRVPHRAELVRDGVRAAGAGMLGVICGDGTRPAWPAAAFDRVLLDAPCSGLGALRRRPEARWRRRPEDLDDLVPLQERLLDGALDAVRPGGVVVYATCSPVVRETAGVVQSVLARRSDTGIEDAPALLPEVSDARSASLAEAAQLWPHRHGTDAMFVALLRRLR